MTLEYFSICCMLKNNHLTAIWFEVTLETHPFLNIFIISAWAILKNFVKGEKEIKERVKSLTDLSYFLLRTAEPMIPACTGLPSNWGRDPVRSKAWPERETPICIQSASSFGPRRGPIGQLAERKAGARVSLGVGALKADCSGRRKCSVRTVCYFHVRVG